MNFISSLERRGPWALFVGVMVGVFCVAALAQAATTISTSIATAGGYTQSGSSANTFTGATAVSGALSLTSTFTLGSSGTAQANQIITTCSMIANNSIAASSTGYAYCTGVTGVTSADLINANFASSTQGSIQGQEGFIILNAFASSTSGSIDFIIANYAGRATAPSAAGRIGSTTVIRAAH